MNNKYWHDYLFNRVMLLSVSQTVCAIGVITVILITDSRITVRWLIFAGILLMSGFAVAWWIWVIKPYTKMEHEVKLFLDGYTPENELSAIPYSFSPTSVRMIERLVTIISPSNIFNQNKRRAQYLALQNQINPHFLYNTLDSIRSEAIMAKLDNIADMTEALASFFRYTISKVENLVSVEEELQNCETYFRIQQYRFEDRLQMQIKADSDEWEMLRRCRLPKLTLQPILENAIIHGTELKMGVGIITIYFECTDKRLLIRVSDNGLGMDEQTLAKLNDRLGKNALAVQEEEQRKKGGLALVNVDHRIRLLFGDEYGLHIFSVLGSGTDVEVSIPIVTVDSDVTNREVLQ